jgi:uncharacterized protein (DUF433 family)
MSIQSPEQVDLSKYIETRLFDKRPHIRGRRIPVAIVVYQQRANNWTIGETATNFSLSEAQVLAALLYYDEHQPEIDQQEAEERRLFDVMKLHGEG